ncbi:putative 6-phospho-beta-glucosidase [Janibacter sp. HTCC2649]|uniref:6-phospho-beta-glucosidase n=1 Tax=Janibacter sp. HTCC2649 TaxID=313589 RepID=UPI0000670B21|nr:6-phospho-beta-glucosidase [Janibacter sp. HTCC2649]EAP99871.1 putative 6-phospho-beta-glucosidase [Janibacter sp. HTCC2649]
MKLTILGGGGFRVPLVHGALLRDDSEGRVTEVVLHDLDEGRLAAVTQVLTQAGASFANAPLVTATTDLDEALRGADFVFSAIRVGGLVGRTLDERVALDLGVLGQETTGPGGLAYALRTVPVALDIARRAREVAPDAWFINFTNPAGIVTEAMQGVLGDRVIGICDSPIALARRAIGALGLEPAATAIDYVGLNHLGWLRGLRVDGTNHLPRLLADPAALRTLEEGRLFGTEWIQALGAIPNEYLYYYYFSAEARAAILSAAQTRGEFLRDQQDAFYVAVASHPDNAATEWHRVREERDATYMREARAEDEERDEADVAGGGYEGVALAIMAAISHGETSSMILNIRGGGAVPGMPDSAVVEIPCVVDSEGPHAIPLAPVEGHMLGLMQQVKAVERLVIEAATTGSRQAAIKAFALHPLVDSVSTARSLFEGYRRAHPELAALFADT